MFSINNVVIGGNLTRDPKLSKTHKNKDVVNFGIAINSQYNDNNGEKQSKVCYVDCSAFDKLAININKYFRTGRPILVEGYLQYEQWIDKDTGKNRDKVSVKVMAFNFVDYRENKNGNIETTETPETLEKVFGSNQDYDTLA